MSFSYNSYEFDEPKSLEDLLKEKQFLRKEDVIRLLKFNSTKMESRKLGTEEVKEETCQQLHLHFATDWSSIAARSVKR